MDQPTRGSYQIGLEYWPERRRETLCIRMLEEDVTTQVKYRSEIEGIMMMRIISIGLIL
jgi:hypothetical protein